MQEIVFLKQNAPKWKRFEGLMADPRQAPPDLLAGLFIELTDDLSYARTFFPDSNTTRYLNGLAMNAHQQIYRNKKEEQRRFVTFWKTELPCLFFLHRRALLYALIVFVSAVFIGVVSAANDEGFVRLILGDGYVNMTLAHIERGDPLAVYKSANQSAMFLGVTFNNIRVALYAFIVGAFLSFGTAFILLQNGIMVGVFHHFFYAHGLLAQSLKTVWIHGALELPAVILAGGAGLVIGNSILFPGTYSRLDAFRRGAREGMKMAVGLVPIFILAGFLEGFVTRYTGMPLALSLTIIGGSLAFIVWYVILYPRRLVQKEAPHDSDPGSY
jgi:uncharacterized membrane protein SpoIIM required for sporulation